jgi:GT2 family glycosyltransferase
MYSVIIPTFNRALILEKNLEKLMEIRDKIELIIIDDGSKDITEKIVEKYLRIMRITYHKNKKNMGSPYSWNLGIQLAKNDSLLLLNDDTFIINPQKFLNILKIDLKSADIIGFKIIDNESKKSIFDAFLSFFAGNIYFYQGNKQKYVDFTSGCMLITRKVSNLVKFNLIYKGNAYREESDFQVRARKFGFKILYDPNLSIYHLKAKKGGQRERNDKKWYIINHLIFLRRNFKYTKIYKVIFFMVIALLSSKSIRQLKQKISAIRYAFWIK